MASSRISSRPPRGPVDKVVDLFDSVKRYARQETLEPIKGAIRWVGVGSVAALSLGLALVFSALGILRLSQDLGGTVLDGSWSFLHYFITLSIVAILVAVTFSRVSRRSLAKDS
jgi:cytochrome c biogenesis protein CcdA